MIGNIGAALTALCILLLVGYGLTRRQRPEASHLFAFLFVLAILAWIVFMFGWAAPAAMDHRQF